MRGPTFPYPLSHGNLSLSDLQQICARNSNGKVALPCYMFKNGELLEGKLKVGHPEVEDFLYTRHPENCLSAPYPEDFLSNFQSLYLLFKPNKRGRDSLRKLDRILFSKKQRKSLFRKNYTIVGRCTPLNLRMFWPSAR